MPSLLTRLFETARALTLDPWPAVERWKQARPGRRVVASLGALFPAELAEAAGMLHLGVWGASDSDLGPRVPPLCPMARFTLAAAGAGRLALADLVVVVTLCEDARDLAVQLPRLLGARPVHALRLHAEGPASASVEAATRELAALAAALEEASGRPITALRLRAALHQLDRQRGLVRELLALRERRPDLLSHAEAMSLVRAGSVVPKLEHYDLLVRVLAALETEGRPRRRRAGARVVMVGPSCWPPSLDLLEAIEAAGLHVVDDDVLWGSRVPESPRHDGNPLTVLAEGWVKAAACAPEPFRRDPDPGARLVQRLHEASATGVLFAWPRCPFPPASLERMRRALEKAEVPYLVLDVDPAHPITEEDREALERLSVLSLAAA